MAATDTERQTVNIEGNRVDLTSLDKMIWPLPKINKAKYLHYLYSVSSVLLPWLRDRTLTVIRYPQGLEGDSFYQKNAPAYTPSFIPTHMEKGTNYIVCSELATLIWLGNQLALEFHIPFNLVDSRRPSEIVFDLDPPSVKQFHLAVEAALMLRELFDRLKLHAFVKTSGNKGLQVYIPLPKETFTYEESRLFTSFVAQYLTAKKPDRFTTERLKKKRGGRLYVDYLQHAPGKTIIAPYSPRANPSALVATPLFWDEVTPSLRPDQFSVLTVPERIKEKGCPFHTFEQVRDNQTFASILDWIKEQ